MISAARTRPINSPGPPLLNKTKASPIALTSGGAQEGARRGAAHAAPPSSLRPGLPRGSSSRVGDGCSGRRSGIRSLPRTQHLERRTAPRLIPLTPPPSSCSSQWRRRIRPGGCPLGGSGPSVGTSSPEAARVFALPAGTCSLLGMWWSGLVLRAGKQMDYISQSALRSPRRGGGWEDCFHSKLGPLGAWGGMGKWGRPWDPCKITRDLWSASWKTDSVIFLSLFLLADPGPQFPSLGRKVTRRPRCNTQWSQSRASRFGSCPPEIKKDTGGDLHFSI